MFRSKEYCPPLEFESNPLLCEIRDGISVLEVVVHRPLKSAGYNKITGIKLSRITKQFVVQ